jgi:hypothetical protein
LSGALAVRITAVHNRGEIIHVDPTLIAESFDAKFCKNTNCGAKEIINKYDNNDFYNKKMYINKKNNIMK